MSHVHDITVIESLKYQIPLSSKPESDATNLAQGITKWKYNHIRWGGGTGDHD